MLKTESEFKKIVSNKNNKEYYIINTYYYVNDKKVKVNTYFLNYKEIILLGLEEPKEK